METVSPASDSKVNLKSVVLIVMGPSACGKSEVASALSNYFRCPYIDADSLHPKANIDKMENGIPLTDQDRLPWLSVVRNNFANVVKPQLDSAYCANLSHSNDDVRVEGVVACSALTKYYRSVLRGESENSPCEMQSSFQTVFVYLDCSEEVLRKRISERKNHFMKANMLQSQLKTLEKPGHDEYSITVNGDNCLDAIITEVKSNISRVTWKTNSSL